MNLKYGDHGSLVEMLQYALYRFGSYSGSIDGLFGAQTNNALRSFQQAEGISEDLTVGNVTWNRLSRFIRAYGVYFIKKGDTLWDISNLYNTSVRRILVANPGIRAENLRIGQRIIVPFGYDVVPTSVSWSWELLRFVCDGIAARYPFVRLSSLGRSVQGRNLYCLNIGSGDRQLSFNASHHANEWITTPAVMKFLEDYAQSYSDSGYLDNINIRKIYSQTDLYVVPMVNPDGVDLVTQAEQSGLYFDRALNISDKYPDIEFPFGWKANILGTDLNLNYPAGWEQAREIKYSQGYISPAPRDYVGTAPLSAPESRSMYAFTLNHDFRFVIAYHTQGEIIYWKYDGFDPPYAKKTGDVLSNASGYPLELAPEESSYAGYKDWFISFYNRPGYTVEAGKGTNPLDVSQFDSIYKANLPLMLSALKIASE